MSSVSEKFDSWGEERQAERAELLNQRDDLFKELDVIGQKKWELLDLVAEREVDGRRRPYGRGRVGSERVADQEATAQQQAEDGPLAAGF